MAVFVRALIVIFAFLVAAFAAAMVITLGMLIEWEGLVLADNPFGAWAVFGLYSFFLSGMGLLPAFIIIVLAESFAVRSVLFYAIAGGLGLVALYYGVGFPDQPGSVPMRRELEIMAAAGIAAGFVYWAIAGRKAGAWRKPRRVEVSVSRTELPPP